MGKISKESISTGRIQTKLLRANLSLDRFKAPKSIGGIMAHEVSVNLKDKFVLHKDVEVEIKRDNSKLGKLLISKGNVEWLPGGN